MCPRRRWPRAGSALAMLWVLVVFLVGGCGAEAAGDQVRIVLSPGETVEGSVVEQAADVIRRRLDALESDAEVEEDSGDVVVVGPTDDTEQLAEMAAIQGVLRFRPVLDLQPALGSPGATGSPAEGPPGLEATPPEDDAADAEVTLEDEVGEFLYRLGPTLATGRVVESAEAELDPAGQWQVALTMHAGADGIDQFNQAAATCNPPGELCPTGQLAIVLDSVVQSAPIIQEPSFQRDEIVISGQFRESEARDLALVLSYGALPVPLEVRSVEALDET